jgi:hypothetical protein
LGKPPRSCPLEIKKYILREAMRPRRDGKREKITLILVSDATV